MNNDGAQDDKKKRQKEAEKKSAEKEKKKSESEKTIDYGNHKGTYYESGLGNVHQTTGAHKSTMGPTSTKHPCVGCGISHLVRYS